MIKRQMLGSLTGIASGLAVFAWGQHPPMPANETEQTKLTASKTTIAAPPPSRAAESLLRTHVDAIHWRDKPFEEVLDWLGNYGDGRVNTLPKWGPLKKENVTRESLVNLRLSNTIVADVLNETLDQLSPNGEIGYHAIENKLTISTRRDFDRKLYLRVYYVEDILRIMDPEGKYVYEQHKLINDHSTADGGGKTSNQDNSSRQPAQHCRAPGAMLRLKQIIESIIAPESWEVTDTKGRAGNAAGARGRIEVIGYFLFINNTNEVHEAIAGPFSLATIAESTVPVSPSSPAAMGLLRKHVDAVVWKEKTFEEVLDWLRDTGEGRVGIVPEWGALSEENVTPKTLVSLQLSNTMVADVLNETLDLLSEDGEIRYHAIENKLTVSTRRDFDRKLYVRVYEVEDILRVLDPTGHYVSDIEQEGPVIVDHGTADGGGRTGNQDYKSGQPALRRREPPSMLCLKQTIERMIAPETWEVAVTKGEARNDSGGRGSIEVLGRSLVVRNTIEVHEAIAGAFYLE